VASVSSSSTATIPRPRPKPKPKPKPGFPPYPQLLRSALGTGPTSFVPAARWHGQIVAWLARTSGGVAMLELDQRSLELRLHSGTVDAGATGWRWGPAALPLEQRVLLGAFNGGFKLSTGAGGFESAGRVAVPVRAGLGSIVTYSDGASDIGSWHGEVPAAGLTVASVRQNLALLIDHGVGAPNLGCIVCWGATLGGVSAPARSALGITASGTLIWAGGESLTPTGLAAALLGAHVVRAVELDINPEWVAAYLYQHGTSLTPVPVVPGQHGIPGFFLVPWSRDFYTVAAR
jgi:hypothetical protein